MAKKIAWGIAVSVLVIGLMVLAACSRDKNGVHKDVRGVWGGILSPQQLKALLDFRGQYKEKVQKKAGERPDLYATWKELDLSEEQQGQILKIVGDLMERAHPSLIAASETADGLEQVVFEGDPDHPAIPGLSAQLGKEIGEISWNLALARGQVRSVLTAEQMEVWERLRSQRDLRWKEVGAALPGMAEDLAALWSRLKITPDQADALEGAFRRAMRSRQNRQSAQYDGWKADLAKILTPEQMAVANRFREKQAATGKARFLNRVEEGERFHNELALTGEQKVKLVQFALDRRAGILPAIQGVMNAAGELCGQIHADHPDRSAIMAAAAKVGEALGQAARVGAGLLADARGMLTAEQMDLVKSYTASLGDHRLDRARTFPARFHELIGLLDELALSPGQKDQVVKLISEKKKTNRGNHSAMEWSF